jgi:hypothetical protein
MSEVKKADFNLHHVMLYSKHWYKRSDNIWEDLKKCLSGDDFSGEYMDKYDVAYLLLNAYDKLPFHGSEKLVNFVSAVAKENCWKHGYYTKDFKFMKSKEDIEKEPEYDYWESVVRFILSTMSHISPKEEGIELKKPDYKNVLPHPSRETKAKVKEFWK